MIHSKSAIYFQEEQEFGNGPCVVNHDFPGHREQLYYSRFSLREADALRLENVGPINKELRKKLKVRIKEAVTNKGYTFHTVHWNSQLVLYFKRNPNESNN